MNCGFRCREHRLAGWAARVVVVSVFACMLLVLFSGVAAALPIPVPVGSAATGGYPYSVCVQGGYAYVVGGSDTLQVFEVSDPLHPTSVGSAATGSWPNSVCVQGGYAYVVNA
ncbi:MAG: hypothetical protein KJ993_15205, partial [Actinobacteria bacterium]|nr:hypothetical protein [Actinomycetota bacterium]